MQSPKTPFTLKKLSNFYSPQTIKRSKVPPPLDLTPPQTIKKQKYTSESPLYSKQNNNINEHCAICSELISTKLSNERILKLNCTHSVHYDCYSLYLNDKNSFNCIHCGQSNLKLGNDYDIMTPIYDQYELTPDDDITLNNELLPEFQSSAFNPNFNDIPITPLNQMTTNSNPQGFQISPKSSASTSTPTSSLSSPKIMDLSRPTINLISYEKNQTISNVLNIFTNELEDLNSDTTQEDESEIKKQIHANLITLLNQSIQNNENIDFVSLPLVKFFDSFEISINGLKWEPVNCFIFGDLYLILVNEKLTSIIGSIMLKDHFCSFNKINNQQLCLNLNSSSLPELQIRSNNLILISKYENYLSNFKNKNLNIPLIQTSTNLWNLVDLTKITIPNEIKKFNELSSKGLQLPINLLKSIIPKPSTKSINLILIIQVLNFTNLSNDEYLNLIKSIIRNTLTNLNESDKFGLIIQGRDGERNFNIYKSSYLGMTSINWDGWDEIINELKVFKPTDRIDGNLVFSNLLNILEKLKLIMNKDDIKQLVFINGLKNQFEIDETEISRIIKQILRLGMIFNHIDINIDDDDRFNKKLIELFINYNEVDGNTIQFYKNFKYLKFKSLIDLHSNFSKILLNFKKFIISSFQISIKLPDCYILRKIEYLSIKEEKIREIVLNMNGLHDGFFKNFYFELELRDSSADLSELPIIYKYNENEFSYSQKLKVNSLSKDSILVKREIELVIIDFVQSDDLSVSELQSLINDTIKGCSTKYLNFFKLSEFNKFYKNFVNYIDQLNKSIEQQSRDDLIINLKLEKL